MDTLEIETSTYKELLKHFITTQDEQALYGAEKITRRLIQKNILPEEIVHLHIQALNDLFPEMNHEIYLSMKFLLETMTFYGMSLQENRELKEQQLALKSEISIAADMQKSLLATNKPSVKGLDIGVASVPAYQMNGDYYHFVQEDDGSIGIAIADIRGKGVPAALCMSMIKYSMESFPKNAMTPRQILNSLNRVVAKKVDIGMFITMFYAQYFPEKEKMVYASAGHEPGYYYDSQTGCFEVIETKGLVLGVSCEFNYEQYERCLKKGDIVILLTDGVTESKIDNRFIEEAEILEIIKQYMELPAQEAANQVYKHFERLQEFQLKDDFTIILLKKEV